MAGLAFFIIIGTMIFAVVFVAKQAKSWLTRIGIVCAAFILVFGDEMYGQYKLKEMCKNSGKKVYQIVSNVDGLEIKEKWDTLTILSNYKYIEGFDNGIPTRVYVNTNNGKIIKKETNILFKSNYIYEEEHMEFSTIYGEYGKTLVRIKNKSNQQLLAESIAFGYGGGWFNNFIAGLVASSGSGGQCGYDNQINYQNISLILQPANKEIQK